MNFIKLLNIFAPLLNLIKKTSCSKKITVIGGGNLINQVNVIAYILQNELNRYIPLTIIPTTFLAMADAAYGSVGMLNDGLKKIFQYSL